MKKLKFMQNAIGFFGIYRAVTTMNDVYLYLCGVLIGKAGVQRSEDFDFESLARIALHKPGSSLEVA